MMSIRADSLAAHGAEGRNGGDVRLGELLYTPKREGNGYGEWDNVHECYCGHSKGKNCEGSVSFCINCNSDHHSDGYQSCQCGGKGFE